VAAAKVSEELRREREVETIHRGNQYVRAIRLYYKKSNTYPATIEVLEKAINVRYLRQRYIDPMTGKDDWRLIHVGEAKTTVKGFFGQPLAGLATGPGAGVSPGSTSGTTTPGTIGAAGATGGQQGLTSVFGSSGAGGYGASSPGGGGLGSSSSGGLGGSTLGGGSSPGGNSTVGGLGSSAAGTSGGLGSNSAGSGTTGSGTAGSGTAGSGTTGSPSTIGGQSASTFSGSATPFVGVGVPKEGNSITILNEQTTYNTWEFLYDPRIEQLYAKGALQGAGANALGSGSGSGSGSGTGIGGTNASGFGSSPSSGFGSSPGSGFGSSGSSPGSSSPTIGAPITSPTTPQQQPK
jgi:hypothetical protein